MPGPILEVSDDTDDLVLRTVERDDAAFVQRAFADPYARCALHVGTHKSEAEVETFMEEEVEDDDNAAYIACVDAEDAPFDHPDAAETTAVAFLYVRHVDHDQPTVVCWVPPEHRGAGHAGPALELGLDALWRVSDVHTVGASVVSVDEFTRDLVSAVGFTEEARNREAQFVDGAYRDEIHYGLLRTEWEAQ
ncbi:GNAT family N-acetyltransferase [Halobacterium salinarum]|uniref:GNAT family N-acetyltransferase n=1 Tax=Halobacterium salinarum TaxID=2242 RepID=UPI001F325770|nr:GNAT family protein [Halobacterium salinarum]MCF2207707.1 GNAT family N-acetyltransferase [Halobacterium salinarum]